jgi:hypothetical protein
MYVGDFDLFILFFYDLVAQVLNQNWNKSGGKGTKKNVQLGGGGSVH